MAFVLPHSWKYKLTCPVSAFPIGLPEALGYLISTMKHQKRFGTAHIWNVDHFTFLLGTFQTGMARDAVDTLISVIRTYKPDAVVDFWIGFGCTAARAYGSCQTGLFTGTPSLVIPTYSEWESNARRVTAAGAGDYVLPTSDDIGKKKQVIAAKVSDKVNYILSAPSFRENAGRLSKKLLTYGGAPYAASLIEGFV